MAVAADRTVYVAEMGNQRIQVFASDGSTEQWEIEGTGFFGGPTGVAVAPDGRTVYATRGFEDTVLAFRADGSLRDEWGQEGSNPGQFENPRGVAVAPDGTVYVVDAGNHRIQAFCVISWAAGDRPGATPRSGTPVIPSPAATPVASVHSCEPSIRIDPSAMTWELVDDCTTELPIEVPDGWTFDGRGHTIWVVDPPGARFAGGVVTVRGGTGTVTNVTIDGAGLAQACASSTAVSGVLFSGAAGAVTETTIRDVRRGRGDHCGSGIGVVGPASASVTVRGNTIQRAGDQGIDVSRATVEATGNQVSDVGGNGIRFEGAGTKGTIRRNTVTGAAYGINIREAAEATVAGNEVTNVSTTGILGASGATIIVHENNRVRGGDIGILIAHDGTTGTVDGNTVMDASETGIRVQEGGAATVSGNTVEGAGSIGIWVELAAQAQVTENIVRNAADWGIVFTEVGTTGSIRGNTVEAAGIVGIGISRGAHATISDNTVVESAGWGIGLQSSATGTVSNNTVTNTRKAGIQVIGEAEATVSGNTVEDPGGSGIDVQGERTHASLMDITVIRPGPAGILVTDAANAAISGNVVTDANSYGVRVQTGATADVTDNEVTGGPYGIVFIGAETSGTITGNTVRDAQRVGVHLGEGVAAAVTGNTITGPGDVSREQDGPYGIQVQRGVSGAVTANQLADHRNTDPRHTACGIVIDLEAPEVLVTDNRFPAPGNEVDLCDERAAAAVSTPVPVATPVSMTDDAAA